MNTVVRVGMSTCGRAAGAQAVYTALQTATQRSRPAGHTPADGLPGRLSPGTAGGSPAQR